MYTSLSGFWVSVKPSFEMSHAEAPWLRMMSAKTQKPLQWRFHSIRVMAMS
jgi:hypothetical protein